jgi:hypothetical protein
MRKMASWGVTMSTAVLSKPVWRRALWVAGLLVVFLGVGRALIGSHLAPIVRHRALGMLRSRFDSEAEIGDLQVSVLHGISVAGKRLAFTPPRAHRRAAAD